LDKYDDEDKTTESLGLDKTNINIVQFMSLVKEANVNKQKQNEKLDNILINSVMGFSGFTLDDMEKENNSQNDFRKSSALLKEAIRRMPKNIQQEELHQEERVIMSEAKYQ
jgi:hypothetical protein